MKSITISEFLELRRSSHAPGNIDGIIRRKERWTALEILQCEGIGSTYKLRIVLRVALIDSQLLHEIACRFAEELQKQVTVTDPVNIAAIEAKRAWLRSEISDEQLYAARRAAVKVAWVAKKPAEEAFARSASYAADLDPRVAAGSIAAISDSNTRDKLVSMLIDILVEQDRHISL